MPITVTKLFCVPFLNKNSITAPVNRNCWNSKMVQNPNFNWVNPNRKSFFVTCTHIKLFHTLQRGNSKKKQTFFLFFFWHWHSKQSDPGLTEFLFLNFVVPYIHVFNFFDDILFWNLTKKEFKVHIHRCVVSCVSKNSKSPELQEECVAEKQQLYLGQLKFQPLGIILC